MSAASEYAKRRGYGAVVLDVAGQPQSQESPQAKAALKKFFEDPAICAFYGFSGGGYNLRHILDRLASRDPDALHRIDLIVVLGAPLQPKAAYEAFKPTFRTPYPELAYKSTWRCPRTTSRVWWWILRFSTTSVIGPT